MSYGWLVSREALHGICRKIEGNREFVELKKPYRGGGRGRPGRLGWIWITSISHKCDVVKSVLCDIMLMVKRRVFMRDSDGGFNSLTGREACFAVKCGSSIVFFHKCMAYVLVGGDSRLCKKAVD